MTVPYLGHLVRVSALEFQPAYPTIRVRVQLLFDPADLVGTGIQYYRYGNDDEGEDEEAVYWLEEVQAYRYATVRCNAFSFSDALISVSRGQHDIKVDLGGPVEQFIESSLQKKAYLSTNFVITPSGDPPPPKLGYDIGFTAPGSIDVIDGAYGQFWLNPPSYEHSGEGGTAGVNDTLTVSINGGGSLIYTGSAFVKIGAFFYIVYSPPS
jgi:hypothetical protein